MKKIISIFVTACFMWGFVSCIESQYEPESYMVIEDGKDFIALPGTKDSVMVKSILSNTRWLIDTAALDTLMITDYYIGANRNSIVTSGSADFHYTVGENHDQEGEGNFVPRSTVIRLHSDDPYVEARELLIRIEQGAGKYRVRLGDDSKETVTVNVAASATTASVEYDINGEWRVLTPPGVLDIPVGENEMSFEFDANTTGEEREIVVVFEIIHSPYPKGELRIIQAAE